MNRIVDRTAAAPPAIQGKTIGFAAKIVRMLWIVPAATLLCLVLFLSIGHIKLSESGLELAVIFVFCVSIAPPSILLCNWIGHRFSEQYPSLVMAFYALALVCTATTGTLAGALLLQWAGIVPHGAYWHEFRTAWPFNIVINLMVGLSISTFETMRFKLKDATLELRTRQVEQERAHKLLAEARLTSLESRIHPHFLFNTLNSIASLIPTDPKRAEDTVSKLASLLRFSLNAQHNGLAPLAQESKVVRDYLEIEATRFGQRLSYQISIPASLEALKVPPLALQTLVENCVKHVASTRSEGAAIQITGSASAGILRLEVLDDGPGFSLDAVTPEHGLGNLVARLELLYGDRAQLDVFRRGDHTVVSMTLPAEA